MGLIAKTIEKIGFEVAFSGVSTLPFCWLEINLNTNAYLMVCFFLV